MPANLPIQVTVEDAHTQHHRLLADRVLAGIGLLRGTLGQILVSWDGTQYVLSLARQPAQAAAGSFRGEYDSTKDYAAGDTFIIADDTTIAGIAVVAGYYGVPPAGTDSKGDWYGYVPANPTGNAVPQHPLPAIGAAPNDKFYARLIVAYC